MTRTRDLPDSLSWLSVAGLWYLWIDCWSISGSLKYCGTTLDRRSYTDMYKLLIVNVWQRVTSSPDHDPWSPVPLIMMSLDGGRLWKEGTPVLLSVLPRLSVQKHFYNTVLKWKQCEPWGIHDAVTNEYFWSLLRQSSLTVKLPLIRPHWVCSLQLCGPQVGLVAWLTQWLS